LCLSPWFLVSNVICASGLSFLIATSVVSKAYLILSDKSIIKD
jgi:hypothetical protein